MAESKAGAKAGVAAGAEAVGRDAVGRDAESVSRFVEHFAAQLVEAGVPRMPARVFAALLASDAGALTSVELGEQLRISPAAVSGAVRYLAQVHLVSREREPGSRRERYRVHGEQWYEALTNREALIKRWEESLREGVASLGADTPAGRRLSETLAFFEFIETEVEAMMGRWRVHRDEMFGRG
ncbi:MarR family transcriptional regulator [Streptomyces europaeiscabiei]|uniref:GbsR/MarR family transcriptional regulator n=1 Tax=Streptomyces TaxID=1883 RepID=UPI000A36B3EC|nr:MULTISPECIES: MarR family transcriptional regulator [Streptomyces]MDX3587491.1 MarR family transcriptional regulator [Streptomyces europaeiscabiei]MDX3619105.1 MarR family transcriptional regulator [Streptomyces europaeiscabiei]WUD34398.1 MarR family transcriptional regulator [Streptomyces europaeiscabiei]